MKIDVFKIYPIFIKSRVSIITIIEIDDLGFDLPKISLSAVVEASCNIANAMVILKRLYKNSCSFWLLQIHFTKITNAVFVPI